MLSTIRFSVFMLTARSNMFQSGDGGSVVGDRGGCFDGSDSVGVRSCRFDCWHGGFGWSRVRGFGCFGRSVAGGSCGAVGTVGDLPAKGAASAGLIGVR